MWEDIVTKIAVHFSHKEEIFSTKYVLREKKNQIFFFLQLVTFIQSVNIYCIVFDKYIFGKIWY